MADRTPNATLTAHLAALAPMIRQAELERLLYLSPRYLTRCKNGHIATPGTISVIIELLASAPARQIELLRRIAGR